MTNVVQLDKVRDFQAILSMCDATEMVIKKDRRLSDEQRIEKLRRVTSTRAKCVAKLDELTKGAKA